MELEFEAEAAELGRMRDQVRSACLQAGCGEKFSADVVLAVNEACMNVIQHAYQGLPGRLRLRLAREEGELVVQIMDLGNPVDPSSVHPRDLDDLRPGGLGTHFMRELMDEVSFLPAPPGWMNLLQMKKRIK